MNADCLENDGFTILSDILTNAARADICASLRQIDDMGIGSRSLLDMPWCQALAQAVRRHPAIVPMLPADSLAVQCNYFEKSPERNWLVPMHQDLSIPVMERLASPELTGWSEKEGTVFVQAPERVLRELVAVRLHIDECAVDDGALRVVPGSHKFGRLDNADALGLRDRLGEVVCAVKKGGALLMKPLVLHASSKASGHSRRRVLHLVFGPRCLPLGLRWRQAV